jgi:hypothetical protein
MGENVTLGKDYLEFNAPCCTSARTCRHTAHYIISLTNARILRKINAVRCYQGIEEKYKFYPSDDVILVHYYCSTRGVNYLQVLWKPQSIDVNRAVEVARKAIGLEYESVIVLS